MFSNYELIDMPVVMSVAAVLMCSFCLTSGNINYPCQLCHHSTSIFIARGEQYLSRNERQERSGRRGSG